MSLLGVVIYNVRQISRHISVKFPIPGSGPQDGGNCHRCHHQLPPAAAIILFDLRSDLVTSLMSRLYDTL
ncbi:hypothetical protein BDR04DRAFT_810776 [Suillus decipiens]|nr:hypothetical protein BDR04DRAFT_810776 [Suillus decipiens]